MKQTAGRDQLGTIAPLFAHLNDDVLFGEVWDQEAIDIKTKCIVTVTTLMASGITDASLAHHLANAKAHGVSRDEIVAVVTHAAMYCGWPKGWAVFRMIKEVWGEDEQVGATSVDESQGLSDIFPMGEPNDAYAQYFIGRSWLAPLGDPQLGADNVTFEPGCRNSWHIHHASKGGGRVLICVDGEGWYQEEGKPARRLRPGDVVEIPANVKHWHGAAAGSWFSHLAFEYPGENCSNEWLEPVDDEHYNALEA